MNEEIESLQLKLRDFANERDWGQFHSPKNLACALSVEAAELLEHFQWQTDEQSRGMSEEKKLAISEEVADVFLYLVNLADKLDIDLIKAANRKIQINASKYPVEMARGSMKKYTEF
jgi:NTP pyrophosphatase (non-canonical NTP hydrolase)